jgi:hypothetical protein
MHFKEKFVHDGAVLGYPCCIGFDCDNLNAFYPYLVPAFLLQIIPFYFLFRVLEPAR